MVHGNSKLGVYAVLYLLLLYVEVFLQPRIFPHCEIFHGTLPMWQNDAAQSRQLRRHSARQSLHHTEGCRQNCRNVVSGLQKALCPASHMAISCRLYRQDEGTFLQLKLRRKLTKPCLYQSI